MNKKEKYRDLCKTEADIPIFSKDWWLDAVCGEKNWDVILIEKGGQIVASLPYQLYSKFSSKLIVMPKLTQAMGPWIFYPGGQKYAKKLSYEKEIFSMLISMLPDVDLFKQNFHYSITNWLPFYWNGFEQTTMYTYVIEDLSDLDKVYFNIQSNNHRNIKKAQKVVQCYESDDIEEFYRINQVTFERQGLRIPYAEEFLKILDKKLVEHNSRKILFAKDNQRRIHAALYLVWDKNSAYYLMGGFDPKLRNSESMSFLMWEAIKFASTVTKKFDFEGSMIETIERFFRGFGAVQKPYFLISKRSDKIKFYSYLKQIIKAVTT